MNKLEFIRVKFHSIRFLLIGYGIDSHCGLKWHDFDSKFKKKNQIVLFTFKWNRTNIKLASTTPHRQIIKAIIGSKIVCLCMCQLRSIIMCIWRLSLAVPGCRYSRYNFEISQKSRILSLIIMSLKFCRSISS